MIYIMEKLSQIKIVDYFHDDCAEQYKNYKAFLKLYHDKSDFNIDATWAFFAASYGKSPSDGIGSTVKCKILHASLQRPVNNQILMFHAVKESWKSSIEGIFLMIDKVAVRENLKPWYCCWYYESPPLCPNISIYHWGKVVEYQHNHLHHLFLFGHASTTKWDSWVTYMQWLHYLLLWWVLVAGFDWGGE